MDRVEQVNLVFAMPPACIHVRTSTKKGRRNEFMKQTAEKGNPRMGGTGLVIILSVPAFDDGHWVFLGPTSEKQRKMRATHAHAQFNTPSVLLFSRRSGLRTQSIA